MTDLTTRLHECAKRLGLDPVRYTDLALAHECLAKLPPGEFGMVWHGYADEWCADDGSPDDWVCRGTFIEAVVALCERTKL